MSERKSSLGNGRNVPPLKAHVVIYFLQKEMTHSQVEAFYNYYNEIGWSDKSGHPFTNWKTLACEWIWHKKHLKK